MSVFLVDRITHFALEQRDQLVLLAPCCEDINASILAFDNPRCPLVVGP